MLRFISTFLASAFFTVAAQGSCVSPAGTYTGSIKQLQIIEKNGYYYTQGYSGQMSLSIPTRGNWTSQIWAYVCVKEYDGDPRSGGTIQSEQCASNVDGSSNQAQIMLRERGISSMASGAGGFPGNGTRSNKFDLTTCRGVITLGRGNYINYVINNDGSTIELLNFSKDNDVSNPELEILPIILHRS